MKKTLMQSLEEYGLLNEEFTIVFKLMPLPNPNNPYHCDHPMRKNGKQAKSGAQTYRCKCGFSCTEGDRPAHHPTIGDEPMTQVERNRRYRAKKKEQK